MNLIKRIVQTGVLASALYSGVCSAQTFDEHEPSLLGVANIEAEYQKRGYSKVEGFEQRHGFSLYLTRADANVLSKLEQALSKLSPKLKQSIKDLRIDTMEHGDKAGKVIQAGKTTNGRVAVFSLDDPENGSLYHEAAHAWMHALPREEYQQFLDEWKKIAKFEYGPQHTFKKTHWNTGKEAERLSQIYPTLVKLRPVIVSESTELSKLRAEMDAGNYSGMRRFNELCIPFNKRAEEYNKLAKEYNELKDALVLPREGVFSAYGSTDIREDIAEASKTIFSKPQEAKCLINDSDTRYATKMRLFAEKTGIDLNALLK